MCGQSSGNNHMKLLKLVAWKCIGMFAILVLGFIFPLLVSDGIERSEFSTAQQTFASLAFQEVQLLEDSGEEPYFPPTLQLRVVDVQTTQGQCFVVNEAGETVFNGEGQTYQAKIFGYSWWFIPTITYTYTCQSIAGLDPLEIDRLIGY